MERQEIVQLRLGGKIMKKNTSLLLAALVLWLRTRYQRQVRNTLQKGHDLLEQRVTERTADLTATNQRLRHAIKERERAERVARQTRNDLVQAAKLAVPVRVRMPVPATKLPVMPPESVELRTSSPLT